jgi:hypothetical protein
MTANSGALWCLSGAFGRETCRVHSETYTWVQPISRNSGCYHHLEETRRQWHRGHRSGSLLQKADLMPHNAQNQFNGFHGVTRHKISQNSAGSITIMFISLSYCSLAAHCLCDLIRSLSVALVFRFSLASHRLPDFISSQFRSLIHLHARSQSNTSHSEHFIISLDQPEFRTISHGWEVIVSRPPDLCLLWSFMQLKSVWSFPWSHNSSSESADC